MKKLMFILMTALIAATLTTSTGCTQVDSGEVAVESRWGKVEGGPIEPGLVWYNPISTDIITYDCRYRLAAYKMSSYTKDMQQADLQVAFNFAINPTRIVELHTKYGQYYSNKILDPIVAGAVKDVIGNWEAAELVHSRNKATAEIVNKITEGIKTMPVLVRDINLTNIDFSDVFEKAIEEKQVAQQRAITAKNKTAEIEEEARQKVIAAKAEAEAMQIKGDALMKNQDLVLLEAIQKWDGKAPEYLTIGNAQGILPTMNMKK